MGSTLRFVCNLIAGILFFWAGFYLGCNALTPPEPVEIFHCVGIVFAIIVFLFCGYTEGRHKIFAQQLDDLVEKINRFTDERKV